MNKKRDGELIYYYKNGNKSKECNYLNDTLNGVYIEYFPNGRIQYEGYYVKGLRNGWFSLYDSVSFKKITEIYFSKGETYTKVNYDIDGHCTYYYIRPEIITEKKDTLYLDKNDSIQIVFHQRDTSLKINSLFVRTNPIIRGKEIVDLITVYPKKNENYIHFNNDIQAFIFGRDTGRLFHTYFTIGEIKDERCCDSLDIYSLETSFYYYRK